MSGKPISEETVRITQIEPEEKIILAIRRKIDPSLVTRYLEKYENGIELPPLDVQKGTYLLINGYHRYEALRQLGIEKVKVKLWDVNDQDLIYLAYRLNNEQGQAVDLHARDMLIWRARHSDKKSQKEIGQIFGLTESRVSQILSVIEVAGRDYTPEFLSNLNAQEIKVDLRKKVSKYLILEKIRKGIPQSEIAKEFKITEGRVSQIKKEDMDWHENAAVTFSETYGRILDLINTTLLSGLFPLASARFWKDHVGIRNFSDKFGIIAYYGKSHFGFYNVNQEGFEGYMKTEMIKAADKVSYRKETGEIDMAFIETEPFNQTAILRSLDVTSHRIIFKTKNVEPMKDRLPYLDPEKLDPDVSVKVLKDKFPKHEEGRVSIEVKDDKLILDFVCKHGYHCSQPIEIESYAEGKRGEAKASCDLEVLDKILHSHNRIVYGDIWLNFWKDREALMISKYENEWYKLIFLA